jgi:hypothetical protein
MNIHKIAWKVTAWAIVPAAALGIGACGSSGGQGHAGAEPAGGQQSSSTVNGQQVNPDIRWNGCYYDRGGDVAVYVENVGGQTQAISSVTVQFRQVGGGGVIAAGQPHTINVSFTVPAFSPSVFESLGPAAPFYNCYVVNWTP